MIYLISGPSHTGKTNLAQKLMAKYQTPYISMDHIKMGLVRSGLVPNYVEQDDKMQEVLWPVIREMIKTAGENKQNMIIEGCYIPYALATKIHICLRFCNYYFFTADKALAKECLVLKLGYGNPQLMRH